MNEPERRRSKRTVLDDFTYISVAGDNGGSVLNLSEGGLCFTSIAPIVKNGPVPVWFYDLKQRVEAEGEVVWTDGTHKTGGLRFTALSAEARDRIRRWKDPAAHSPGTQGESAAPAGHLRAGFSKAAPAGSNSLAAVSGLVAANSSGNLAASLPRPEPRPSALSAFSRGLLTGLLVSLGFGAVFLFHAYRRDFGEWLIHLGQEFAAKPEAEIRTAPPLAQSVPPAQNAPPARHVQLSAEGTAPPAAQAPVSQKGKPLPQPAATPAKPQPAPAKPVVVATGSASKTHTSTPRNVLPAPVISFPPTAAAPIASLLPGKATLPQLQPAEHLQPSAVSKEVLGSASSGPPARMYFEVGKFKNPFGAQETTDRLVRLGFPASVQQKSRLWSNSYVVLVGPYSNEGDAESAQIKLVSSDFTPRPFERGSRTLRLRSGVTINGSNTSDGDCEIRWESYVTESVVKFVQRGSVVATASAKWVPSDVKYDRDAIVFRRSPNGSRTLLEVRFAGMKRTLVLGKPS
jgi:cell division protein FtsN